MSNFIMNRACMVYMPLFLQPIKVEHAYGVLKTLKPAEEKVTNKIYLNVHVYWIDKVTFC